MNRNIFQNIGILNQELLNRYGIVLPKIKSSEKLIKGKLKFKNKVVVITGSSSGIGKACAYEFAQQGAKVILAARNENKLIELENNINKKGGNALYVKTDVRKIEDCKNLIDKTIEKHGRIDILINNAGINEG